MANKFTSFIKNKFALSPEAQKNPKSLVTPEVVMNSVNNPWMYAVPDYDEISNKMGGRAGLEKMLMDDEIYAAWTTRRDAAINTPWRLEGGQTKVNKFIYETVKKYYEQMAVNAHDAKFYGYSVFELVYKEILSGFGKYEIGEVNKIPTEAVQVTIDGKIIKYTSIYWGSVTSLLSRTVIEEKFFKTVVNPSVKNPLGEALGSRLYYAWFFRCHGWRYWIKWIEKASMPFMVGKTEPVIGPDGKPSLETFQQALDAAQQGSAIAIDKNSDVQYLQSTSVGQQFEMFNAEVSKRIQKTILGQTLTSDTRGTGSQALGNVHNEVRLDKKTSDTKMIQKTIQNVIDTLYKMNDFKGEIPQIIIEDEKELQIDRATRDKVLSEQGLKFSKQYYIDQYDFKDSDIEIVEKQNVSQPINQSFSLSKDASKSTDGHFCFANKSVTPNQQELDKVFDIAFSKAPAIISNKKALLSIIKSAENEKDLKDKLGGLFESQNEEYKKAIEFILSRSAFFGYLDGKVK